MSDPGVLQQDERRSWHEQGFFVRRGFAAADVGERMLARVTDICRNAARGGHVAPALVMPESRPNPVAHNPEDLISKVFRLHRDPIFEAFARNGFVVDLVDGLLGPDLDCFLSQFIFKTPGAYGQPWHQDSFYFPFVPDTQVGVWLAVTPATLDNGCLWVLPGSHTEPVHEHVPDDRPGSNYGYVQIVDHDMSGAVPVLMEPGDLLVFSSKLMHRSTDNESDGIRAAMVLHYSPAGTVDLTADDPRRGLVNDWMPVRRSTAGSRAGGPGRGADPVAATGPGGATDPDGAAGASIPGGHSRG